MSALVPLHWDSRQLDLACARLDADEQGPKAFAQAAARAFAEAKAQGFVPALTVAKVPKRDLDVALLAEALPGHGIIPLGRELTFRRGPGGETGAAPDGVNFVLAETGGMDPEPFLPLAGEMRHSRFYLDPEVGEARARRVWEASIAEHCRGFAQEVAVASFDGRPAGLATVHLEDGAARLHIVGVLDWARGRGVGKRLMQAVVARHGKERTVSVEAFAANDAACALYKTAGFAPEDEREIVHFWLRG